jgi:hypothetical protein
MSFVCCLTSTCSFDRLFRQANEQIFASIINEQTSDFLDARASNDQSVDTALLINCHNANQTMDQTASSSHGIPMTTILPIQTKSRTEVWISRLPNASSVTETDYESQV